MINLTALATFLSPETAVQYHRASERCMAHIRPSLKRLIKETEKKLKKKLTNFSYIRQHDRVSHTTKVSERTTNRRFYICLLLGRTLFFEEFNPFNFFDDSVYVIEGLGSGTVFLSAAVLRDLFKCIPVTEYDMEDDRCVIDKEVFMEGIRQFASERKKQPGKKAAPKKTSK